MQIVIPMSGFGERFRRAGYDRPKPLIEVDGRPIVEYVVGMFPGETDFLFICNEDHLANPEYRMAETLQRIAPLGKILGIAPHKLGPVHAVLEARDHLSRTEPIVVNYCDFTCYWDWQHFKHFVATTRAEGCIPSYRGFHPHTIWSNYYAYVREQDLRAFDIQEKQPFTSEPRREFASSGTYYFASADIFETYARRMIEEDLRVGGEFYVSLVYKPMFADGRNVFVYELEHFMQWGTPEDLEEYVYWSGAFRNLASKTSVAHQRGTVLMPMAGLGSRFQTDGYADPKPLIPVSGRPMAVQALEDLPKAEHEIFVLRHDLRGLPELKTVLRAASHDPHIVVLDHMTDGQASTCLEGLADASPDEPVTIGACDNGMAYDADRFAGLLADPDVDVIVWGARGYPGSARRPQMYGWIDWDPATLAIRQISVKQPLSNPKTDPIVVGAFTFKRAGDFVRSVERMKSRHGVVNGEYYVDTCINDALALGLKCRVFLIDYYLCWGTPDDLRTFNYWQSCFHKWDAHPYSLEKDRRIPADARASLPTKSSPQQSAPLSASSDTQ